MEESHPELGGWCAISPLPWGLVHEGLAVWSSVSNAGASLDHCREGEAGPHDEVLDLSLTSEVPGVTEGPAGVIKYPT